MKIPSWLTITPVSGNGNGSIQFSGAEHTGRVARTYTATVSNSKTSDCTINVSQSLKTEFVTIQDTAAPEKKGGPLTITGQSNSSKLTFSWEQEPTLEMGIPDTYTVKGESTDNGAEISGDPGATAQYDFSIKFTVPENTTIGTRTATLVVTSDVGQTAKCVITQAAGDAYLWVGEKNLTEMSVTIPRDGSAQTVRVLSNDAWTVA